MNNYSRTRQDTQDLYQPVARFDHNFSEKHRMFARYSHSTSYGRFDELISGSDVRGRLRRRPHRLRESLGLQLRVEAAGAMNHPNFSPPNRTPASTLFGQVTGTQTGQEERRIFTGIFTGLKLIF